MYYILKLINYIMNKNKNAAHMSLEPGSSAWQTDTLPITPDRTGKELDLVVYKVSVKFQRRFSQNSLAIRR